MDIYSAFKETFHCFSFIPPQATIAIAFSGGRDSTALLHLLLKLKSEKNLNILAAYFNHNIRQDAQKEESWVKQTCLKLGVPLIIGQGDIPKILSQSGGNLEEIASRERYGFLYHYLNSLSGSSFLATAHHAGDQLETFLFRLARGSGAQGLLGIAPHIDKRLIRPLHTVSPNQIKQFLLENEIDFYQDPSNESPDFMRNHIRHNIIPELEKINSNLYPHFTRALFLMAEENRFMDDYAQKAYQQISPYPNVLNRLALIALNPAICKRVLRLFIDRNRGNLRNIANQHIEDFLQSIIEQKRAYHLPDLLVDIRHHWVFTHDQTVQHFEFPVEEKKNKTLLDCIPATLTVQLVKRLHPDPENTAVTIPRQLLIYPLLIRSVQRNDRYRKINTDYSQRVWEMLREKGIPKELRHLFPIIINGDGNPIWCYPCPLASQFYTPIPLQPTLELLRFSLPDHPFNRFLNEALHLK